MIHEIVHLPRSQKHSRPQYNDIVAQHSNANVFCVFSMYIHSRKDVHINHNVSTADKHSHHASVHPVNNGAIMDLKRRYQDKGIQVEVMYICTIEKMNVYK